VGSAEIDERRLRDSGPVGTTPDAALERQDPVTFLERGKGVDPELGGERCDPILAWPDPLAAHFHDRPVGERDVAHATTDTVTRLEHRDRSPGSDKRPRRDETGQAGANHGDIDRTLLHGRLISTRPQPMGGRTKDDVRRDVWDSLRDAGVARFPGAHGRIPNFTGAERAADRLAELPEWQSAAVVKANPDLPQLPVRARALAEGKVVYMAVPRLREERPFLRLDPDQLDVAPRKAASIKGSSVYGEPITLNELEHVDLIVCGTVAVNRRGVRVGKGGGYSDLELAIGVEAGVIDSSTVIVTTVHSLQVLEDDLPETRHDFRVDLVVTADDVIRCRRKRRPPGVIWGHLDEEKISAIPVLAGRQRR